MSMLMYRDMLSKTPLFFRVVSLYVSFFLISLVYGKTFNSSLAEIPAVNLSPVIIKPIDYGDVVSKTIIDGQPVLFRVDRLNVSLPVKPGLYDASTDSWTLSDEAVYHANMTPMPNNQAGSTFIYGHNRDMVLAKLDGLVVGDVAIIETANGHIFTYNYVNDSIVQSDATNVLFEKDGPPRLTVMTCDGFFSQMRRLMYFNLSEAK